MSGRPVVVRRDEGVDYDVGDPSRIRVRLTADDSDGLLTVFEVSGDIVRAPSEANQHLHEDFTEVFYLVEGEGDGMGRGATGWLIDHLDRIAGCLDLRQWVAGDGHGPAASAGENAVASINAPTRWR